MLSNIYYKALLVHLWSIPILSHDRAAGRSDQDIPFHFRSSGGVESKKPLLSLFLSKLDKHEVLSCFSQDIPSKSFTNFVVLLWTHWRTFTFFFKCEAQTKNSSTTFKARHQVCVGPGELWALWWEFFKALQPRHSVPLGGLVCLVFLAHAKIFSLLWLGEATAAIFQLSQGEWNSC